MTPSKSGDDYAGHFSKRSFWQKVRRFALTAGKEVIEKVLALYHAALDPDTPRWAKTMIVSALGYFIFPSTRSLTSCLELATPTISARFRSRSRQLPPTSNRNTGRRVVLRFANGLDQSRIDQHNSTLRTDDMKSPEIQPAPPDSDGWKRILDERERQQMVEGFTVEYDRTHPDCRLFHAAEAYALPPAWLLQAIARGLPCRWWLPSETWKPSLEDHDRNLKCALVSPYV